MHKPVPNSTSNSLEQISLRSTIDLLELSWRRKLFFVLGIVTGLVLGLLYYVQKPPQYESTAEVLVVTKRPGVVTGEPAYESSFEDYLATQRALIVSPLIIERAIEGSGLRGLKTFADMAPQGDLTAAIIGKLEAGSGSTDLGESADSIMTLSFRGTEADECPLVVQAVLDSYKAFLDETYRGMSDDTMGLISQARDLLKNDLEQQEEAYSQFRRQSPLVIKGSDEVNPLQDRLAAIEAKRSELLLRRTEMESQLMAIQNAKKEGRDQQQLLAMVSDLRYRATEENALPNVSTTLDNQLFSLVDKQQRLLEHYGPNHPHVVSIGQRIAATRQFLTLPTTAHMQDPEIHVEQGSGRTKADPVEMYTQYLEQELDAIRISEKQLTDLYEREHEAAKELTGYQLKDERYQRNIDRTQQLYDGVISQLQDAGLIKDYGGFEARVIAPPRIGEKVSPNALIVIPGSVFAGMLMGFCLAVVAELSDKSFHTPEEIQSRLGLPVVGQIPHYAAASESERRAVDGDSALDPMLCTYFQPQSPHTESYRALRAALCLNSRGQTHRVIQVSGPSLDDGSSTLAANLAVSIAQSGKQVLLMDADMHRPRQHEIFGISCRTGLGSVVTLEHKLSDAICKTAVNGLWLLPAGPLPSHPSELFTSPRFPELMKAVRENYDYVLIDTAPLLVVSDPCVSAPLADGVLLVLRLSKDSRPRAIRAREILETLEAKLVGVVANGIGGAGSRGYAYEGYGYQVRNRRLL